MFEIRDVYEDRVSEAVRKDRDGIMRAGGYRVEEAWERAIRSAVAGLDIQPLAGMDYVVENPGSDIVMAAAS
jgi:CDK-activating kinase assembly factor MAT1